MEPADARMTWEHVSSSYKPKNFSLFFLYSPLFRLLWTLVRLLPDLQHGGGPGGERLAVRGPDLHHPLHPHLPAQRQGQGAVRHPG